MVFVAVTAGDPTADLVVNPNTVARAFLEFEGFGVLVGKRGLGMEVAPDGPKLCRDRRKRFVLTRSVGRALPGTWRPSVLLRSATG